MLNAVKYSQNIEKVTYLNSIVDSITLNEIAKLAKQLFDDQYFSSKKIQALGFKTKMSLDQCNESLF